MMEPPEGLLTVRPRKLRNAWPAICDADHCRFSSYTGPQTEPRGGSGGRTRGQKWANIRISDYSPILLIWVHADLWNPSEIKRLGKATKRARPTAQISRGTPG